VLDNLGFWAVAAGMVAGAAMILTRALGAGKGETEAGTNLTVYRDQLADVTRDVARGMIAPAEEARLRTEIGRRMLEADQAAPPATRPMSGRARRVAMTVVAAVLVSAIGLYARWGAPGYPDLPLITRLAMSADAMANRPDQATAVKDTPPVAPLPPPDKDFADLMDKLRAAIKSRPGDVAGLALLARNEAALGNLVAAEGAQRQLIAAKGDAASADDYAGLAEAMIRQAGGYVSPQAEAELVRALERDPKNGGARYFSGLMFAQGGRYDRTFVLWQGLLDEGPDDAPWITPIRAQIEDIAFRAGVNYELPPLAGPDTKGPDAGDIAAAADMTPEERQTMIQGMVGQLSDRLASEGGPAEDWAKLIRALGVMGDKDRAGTIYAEAKTRFAGDAAALSFLSEAAIASGLTP
jgi:cytochrome c-type biogenesis protein CcmH